MKYPMSIVLFVFAFLSSGFLGNTQDPILGTPVKVGSIEVAQFDFPEEMAWKDAKKAWTKVGEGWRLPSSNELELLYDNKEKIGGFKDNQYWSSGRATFSKTGYVILNFKDKAMWWSEGDNKWSVRAVRSL
ncbi:MAG: Lcl domain-containing protein [Bacteroidia bacterium]